MSVLLGRRTKGNLDCCFTSFCRFLKKPFCSKSPTSKGRMDRLTPGRSWNQIGHIGNKTRKFSTPSIWYSGISIFFKEKFQILHSSIWSCFLISDWSKNFLGNCYLYEKTDSFWKFRLLQSIVSLWCAFKIVQNVANIIIPFQLFLGWLKSIFWNFAFVKASKTLWQF